MAKERLVEQDVGSRKEDNAGRMLQEPKKLEHAKLIADDYQNAIDRLLDGSKFVD